MLMDLADIGLSTMAAVTDADLSMWSCSDAPRQRTDPSKSRTDLYVMHVYAVRRL